MHVPGLQLTLAAFFAFQDLQGSPVLESRNRRHQHHDDSQRPVSVHGNVIHNHSLYANTVQLSSKQQQQRQLNASLNANLNLSNSSSPGTGTTTGTNQTKTTIMDNSSSRDNSHHSLNTTQLSPIGGRRRVATPQQQQQQLYNNVNAININEDRSRARPVHNSTFHHNLTNGGLNISGCSNGGLNLTQGHNNNGKKLNTSALVPANVSRFIVKSKEAGVNHMISSLGLLCLVSLLLALLSLTFLVQISPLSRELRAKLAVKEMSTAVYEVTLTMCALSLSLNLCCLLVCSIQFLFAVKLVRSTHGRTRYNDDNDPVNFAPLHIFFADR